VPVTQEDGSLGTLTVSLFGHPLDEVFTVVVVCAAIVAESKVDVREAHGFLERLRHPVILT
jgi:hypothetical protein